MATLFGNAVNKGRAAESLMRAHQVPVHSPVIHPAYLCRVLCSSSTPPIYQPIVILLPAAQPDAPSGQNTQPSRRSAGPLRQHHPPPPSSLRVRA